MNKTDITNKDRLMSDNNSVLYKVKVNEFEFSFTQEQIDAVDLIQVSPTVFNLLKNHRSVNAVLMKADQSAKKQTIEIEGENFDIQIKDELDMMLDKMGYNTIASKKIKELIAPMPGLVLEIAVSEGQQVQEGDTILILAAMKMENSIMINTEATIKRIAVSAGQAVEKGQVLVELA
jgi:biotin carboxyl carrier protein